MNCLACGIVMTNTTADYPLQLDNIKITVHDVDTDICTRCGRKVYKSEKIQRLFQIIRST
jgi:YgiT-type zinc finger domain-containing protein